MTNYTMYLTAILLTIASCGCQCGCERNSSVRTPNVELKYCPYSQWEYKVQYSLPTPRPDRNGQAAALATSITPSQDELTTLGKDGWELAGVSLEQETAYPQFDKVAVPNVRPQRLVLIFKRPSCKEQSSK